MRNPFTGERMGFGDLYESYLVSLRRADTGKAYLLLQAAKDAGDPWLIEVVHAAGAQHLREVCHIVGERSIESWKLPETTDKSNSTTAEVNLRH